MLFTKVLYCRSLVTEVKHLQAILYKYYICVCSLCNCDGHFNMCMIQGRIQSLEKEGHVPPYPLWIRPCDVTIMIIKSVN